MKNEKTETQKIQNKSYTAVYMILYLPIMSPTTDKITMMITE
jgi:hypothetical protein